MSLVVVPSSCEALQPFSSVVLTGGSSGIGKSFIELAQKLKPELVICNLSRRTPEGIITQTGAKKLNHFRCDLAVAEEVERVGGEVHEFLSRTMPAGKILLINNSGIGAFGRFPEPNLGQELRMVDLNVRAIVQLTGLLLPLLKARGGTIVNLASTVAFQPTPLCATYGATKAFVLNWTVALNEELRETRVRAVAVCPGTTRTDFFQRAGVGAGGAAGWTMSSEDVASVMVRALAGNKAVVVPGWKNKIMTFLGARVSKPFGAKVSAKVMARMRFSGADAVRKESA